MFYETGWTTEPQSIAQIYTRTRGLVADMNRKYAGHNDVDDFMQRGYQHLIMRLDENPMLLADKTAESAAYLVIARSGQTSQRNHEKRMEILEPHESMPNVQTQRDIRSEARHTDKRIDIEAALKMVYEEFCGEDDEDDGYLWAYYYVTTDAEFKHCKGKSKGTGIPNARGRKGLERRAKIIKARLEVLLTDYARR